MKRLSLDSGWLLTWDGLAVSRDEAALIMKKSDWLDVNLPADIHTPLIEADIISEPLVKLNSVESLWIEQRSWWFLKRFYYSPEECESTELYLENLDYGADIILNGCYIGSHMSTHFPFISDVKRFLVSGKNELLVRLTTGLERVSDLMAAEVDRTVYNDGFTYNQLDLPPSARNDVRRPFVRKPQYTFGWDWVARVPTCGIGGAELRICKSCRVLGAAVRVESLSPAVVTVSAETEGLKGISTLCANLRIEIELNGECAAEVEKSLVVRSGIQYTDFRLEIKNPRIWWPNGAGEQPVYRLKVYLSHNEQCHTYETDFALRTVELNTGADAHGNRFSICVNGCDIYMKGANWIPADAVYLRVPDEKYTALIDEAVNLNFNMLRIWGGGIYERDIFYNECDRRGILVWHDFMFACSLFPDHRPEFIELAAKEADFQTKRLRNHPCIALFGGNNECQWNCQDWFTGNSGRVKGGLDIYNRVLPEIVRKNCPGTPYWNSSPYGGELPNSESCGDMHIWNEATMSPDVNDRINVDFYAKIKTRFVSEYGYPGPLPVESIKELFGGEPVEIKSEIWEHHNNTFERATVLPGILKHYGVEPESITDYIYYGGLCQGHMLSRSLQAFRVKEECGGSLFWMYADCWGETGWTVIDYYLRRKPSYYAVKRALSDRCLITVPAGEGRVSVFAVNASPEPFSGTALFGNILGTEETRISFEADPFGRRLIKTFDIESNGLYCAFAEGLPVLCYAPKPLCELDIPAAKVTYTAERTGEGWALNFTSDKYAHAVELTEAEGLSDNFFDILPGQTLTVLSGSEDCPKPVRWYNI